jgi:hypothetical protein
MPAGIGVNAGLTVAVSTLLVTGAVTPVQAGWGPTKWGMSRNEFFETYPTARMGKDLAWVEPLAGRYTYCDDRGTVKCVDALFIFADNKLSYVDVNCDYSWKQCKANFYEEYGLLRIDRVVICTDGNPCEKMEYLGDMKRGNRIRILYSNNLGREKVTFRFSRFSDLQP